MAAPRRSSYELLVPIVLAAAIVLFALASGSVASLRDIGAKGRWPALLLLLLVALAALRNARVGLMPRLHHALSAAFVGIALLSATWSVDPRLTVERSASIAIVLATAAALAEWAAGSPRRLRLVLAGVLLGAGLVAVGGLLLVAVDHTVAVQAADANTPWRWRGLGENPNTTPMLLAVALPLAGWVALSSARLAVRVGATLLFALLLLEISLSDSRGGFLAALAGCLLLAFALPRSRMRLLAAVAGVGVSFAFALAVGRLPHPAESRPPAAKAAVPARGAASSAPTPRPALGLTVLLSVPFGGCRQEDQVGRPLPGQTGPTFRRTLFGTSGRAQAWQHALDQARQRPVAGYGFGTEDRVFFDCFYVFSGARPENSYLGLLLQLGAAGVAAFLALAVALAVAAFHAVRSAPARLVAVAAAAATLAGLVLTTVQSYIYSAGNIATLSVWVCAFAAAAAGPRRPAPVPVSAPDRGEPALAR